MLSCCDCVCANERYTKLEPRRESSVLPLFGNKMSFLGACLLVLTLVEAVGTDCTGTVSQKRVVLKSPLAARALVVVLLVQALVETDLADSAIAVSQKRVVLECPLAVGTLVVHLVRGHYGIV